MLDRQNGEFLLGVPFAKITWAKGLDSKGRPIIVDEFAKTGTVKYVCPGSVFGAANWPSPSYSPQTRLLYFTARQECRETTAEDTPYKAGELFWGGGTKAASDGEHPAGSVVAIEPLTGKRRWEFKHFSPSWGGILTTAGGLLFTGDSEGYLIALDAFNGNALWKANLGGPITAAPVAYAVETRQYVAIASRSGIVSFSLPDSDE